MKQKKQNKKGFLLVELLVSVFIFTLVATACVGAVLMVLDSNRKIQALKTVMDNLSLTLDTMSRSIATGSTYYCGLYAGSFPIIPTFDCPINGVVNGSESMTFQASDGTHVYYYFDSANKRVKRCILETAQITGKNCDIASQDNDFVSVTSPDMTITNLKFYITGSLPNDNLQPKVTVAVKGYAGVKPSVKTTFNIQTTLSERAVDH